MSQTKGYRINAAIASGQQMTNRISQRSNLSIVNSCLLNNQILFQEENIYFLPYSNL